MERKSNVMKSLIATIIFLAVVIVMVLVYKSNQTKEPTAQGSKEITVQVVIPEEETETFVISTDAENLRQALDEEKLIEGQESEFGFFITSVNGRTADESKQEWWCITKSGEDVFTGVDQTPIQSGDQYELTLTVGF